MKQKTKDFEGICLKKEKIFRLSVLSSE